MTDIDHVVEDTDAVVGPRRHSLLCVQAKRWQATVDRPEVRVVGALA